MSLSQRITEAEVSKIVGRPEIDYYTVDAAGAITHYRWDGAKMAPLLSASAVAAVTQSNYGGHLTTSPGFVPATRDYAGIMGAIQQALSSEFCKNVAFEDALYDLGSNYIPLLGTIGYIGAQPRFAYTNGDWGDKNVRPIGGTRFTTTSDYVFWDGAVDQAAITPNVADQACTTTAGSSVIAVPNSTLFPVGTRVYTPASANGFYTGLSYFVLSSGSNQITLGLADKVAVVAASSGALTVGAGKPNDGTTHTTLKDLIGVGVKRFLKCGAKNTFGFLYSVVDGIWATGGATKMPLFEHTNYSQSTFRRIFTYDGDGQNHGCDYPLGIFIPGNSSFSQLFNANNGIGSSSLVQRGIRFQCETGSNMNEVKVDAVQNNNSVVATQTQTGATTNGSADITVTDGTKYPLDAPVWFSSVGSNTTIYQDLIYFVTSQIGNTIQVSASKGATAVVPNATGAITINAKGFCGLELASVGNGYITSMSVKGIDVEANSSAQLLIQQAVGYFEVLQCSADDSKWGVVGRTASGVLVNVFEKNTTDIDKNCRLMWLGSRDGTAPGSQSYGGFGMWYDKTADMVGLSLHHDSTISGGIGPNRPAFQGVKPSPFPWVKSNFPVGTVQNTRDTTLAFTGSSPVGHIIFAGAAGQTFTLPTIVDAATKTSMVGYSFEFTNASANALTMATSSSQTFNNIAAKTSFSLAANTYAKFIGSKTSGGTLFWTVILSAVLP